MLRNERHGGDKEFRKGLGEEIQNKLDLGPQFLALEFVPVALGQGVSCAQDAIDLVEISSLEVAHHFLNQAIPIGREVFTT